MTRGLSIEPENQHRLEKAQMLESSYLPQRPTGAPKLAYLASCLAEYSCLILKKVGKYIFIFFFRGKLVASIPATGF